MKINRNTPFWDTNLSVEERLDWLLSSMTVDEKLHCLSSAGADIERLGIPRMMLGGEAAHGVEQRNDQGVVSAPVETTSFPQPIGMSASWDPALIREAGRITGTEARVIWHERPDRGLSRWAPTVDIERDPRWGRTEEAYGEDPFLTGAMASAYVRGMQGDDPEHLRCACTLKHFYANNVEEGRGWKSSTVDPRNREELYLEPFRRVIEDGGAAGVMAAYNSVNGTVGMLNHEIQDILKDQYGLPHAVSDGGALGLVCDSHHTFGTYAEAIAASLKAGVDAMSDAEDEVYAAAAEAWQLGLITEEDLDLALRNSYRVRLRLGVYDRERVNPYDDVRPEDRCSDEGRRICRKLSEESLVLLRNRDALLPLDPDTAKTVLVGPCADTWYQDWYGGRAPYRRTLRQGMEEVLGHPVEVCDGLDRVTFEGGGKCFAVDESGRLSPTDGAADVFIKQDWGEGSFTFRSVRTGKYLNLRMAGQGFPEAEDGQIGCDRTETMDWFVLETFGLEPAGHGTFTLRDHFGRPFCFDRDGGLLLSENSTPAELTVTVVEDGAAEAAGAVRKAMAADGKTTVIAAIGSNPMINARETMDRKTILLPPEQAKLLRKLKETDAAVVCMLFTNYPYAFGGAEEYTDAILQSATGSQEMGTAAAEAIFGKCAPAGRLDMTWYASDSQLPEIDDYDIIRGGRTYRYFRGVPQYPFGYGLTYAPFRYSALKVQTAAGPHPEDAVLAVSLQVTNEGGTVSDEVVQIYARMPECRVPRPVRQLVGFERLHDVAPGETRNVTIPVPVRELRYYDVVSGGFLIEDGEYTIEAGASSADIRETCRIAVAGGHRGLRDLARNVAADAYDDCKNTVLGAGHLGYADAEVKEGAECAVLRYDGCSLTGSETVAVFHMRSCENSGIEMLVDGKPVCSWQGETRTYRTRAMYEPGEAGRLEACAREKTWKPVFADVCVRLDGGAMPVSDGCAVSGTDHTQAPAGRSVEIRLRGDAELCWFRLKSSEGKTVHAAVGQ